MLIPILQRTGCIKYGFKTAGSIIDPRLMDRNFCGIQSPEFSVQTGIDFHGHLFMVHTTQDGIYIPCSVPDMRRIGCTVITYKDLRRQSGDLMLLKEPCTVGRFETEWLALNVIPDQGIIIPYGSSDDHNLRMTLLILLKELIHLM